MRPPGLRRGRAASRGRRRHSEPAVAGESAADHRGGRSRAPDPVARPRARSGRRPASSGTFGRPRAHAAGGCAGDRGEARSTRGRWCSCRRRDGRDGSRAEGTGSSRSASQCSCSSSWLCSGERPALVVWFNNASFFVGLDRGYVAIFQGRPGGLLVVQAFRRRAHDAQADRTAGVQRRLPEAGHGGELVPGGPQSRARPLARACAGLHSRTGDDDDGAGRHLDLASQSRHRPSSPRPRSRLQRPRSTSTTTTTTTTTTTVVVATTTAPPAVAPSTTTAPWCRTTTTTTGAVTTTTTRCRHDDDGGDVEVTAR